VKKILMYSMVALVAVPAAAHHRERVVKTCNDKIAEVQNECGKRRRTGYGWHFSECTMAHASSVDIELRNMPADDNRPANNDCSVHTFLKNKDGEEISRHYYLTNSLGITMNHGTGIDRNVATNANGDRLTFMSMNGRYRDVIFQPKGGEATTIAEVAEERINDFLNGKNVSLAHLQSNPANDVPVFTNDAVVESEEHAEGPTGAGAAR
jgi:hypothetical protein